MRADDRSRGSLAILLAGAITLAFGTLVQPGAKAIAQPVVVEDSEEVPAETVDTGRTAPPEGQVYTWRDGDRLQRAYLQANLIVTRDGAVVARGAEVQSTGSGRIVRVAEASSVDGQPVFRSSSGALMTLPGGVLLIFDESWGGTEIDAFFAANDIARGRLSPLGAIPNGYVVATAPGFPSLELANALADLDGVVLSSPNWWRELTTR